MPFFIERNDITRMAVDAIVNTANPRVRVGSGVDAAIHQAAGPALLRAREAIGAIGVGRAAVTPGFGLPAKYVIHTVGPVWRGGLLGEERLLRRCYRSALAAAEELGCESVAFPLISSGNYGFPKDRALQAALDAIRDFLKDYEPRAQPEGPEMRVHLVVFDRESYSISRKRFRDVESFISDHYAEERQAETRTRRREDFLPRPTAPEDFPPTAAEPVDFSLMSASMAAEPEDAPPMPAPMSARPDPSVAMSRKKRALAPKLSLTELLERTDAGFSETLLRLIDQSGKKDVQIYTRANLSRQHFSKIRNNPHYQPTKATAVALALALELDLQQTRDLIGRAGYALTNSSKFDVIIMYFIQEKNYNLFDINAALFEFDQSLLG